MSDGDDRLNDIRQHFDDLLNRHGKHSELAIRFTYLVTELVKRHGRNPARCPACRSAIWRRRRCTITPLLWFTLAQPVETIRKIDQ